MKGRSQKRSKADVQLEVRSEPVIHVIAPTFVFDRLLCSEAVSTAIWA
jgi:hypothetical protein